MLVDEIHKREIKRGHSGWHTCPIAAANIDVCRIHLYQ